MGDGGEATAIETGVRPTEVTQNKGGVQEVRALADIHGGVNEAVVNEGRLVGPVKAELEGRLAGIKEMVEVGEKGGGGMSDQEWTTLERWMGEGGWKQGLAIYKAANNSRISQSLISIKDERLIEKERGELEQRLGEVQAEGDRLGRLSELGGEWGGLNSEERRRRISRDWELVWQSLVVANYQLQLKLYQDLPRIRGETRGRLADEVYEKLRDEWFRVEERLRRRLREEKQEVKVAA